MAFRFEITADFVEEIDVQLKALAEIIRPAMNRNPSLVEVAVMLDKFSLEDVRELARKRFDPEGYEVTIVDKSDGEKPPASAPPVAEAKKTGRPGRLNQEAAKRELSGAAKGDGADDDSAASDKKAVLDRLSVMFDDPKLKGKAVAFTNTVSKANKGVRVSNLPPEKFPEILKQMETEFGAL